MGLPKERQNPAYLGVATGRKDLLSPDKDAIYFSPPLAYLRVRLRKEGFAQNPLKIQVGFEAPTLLPGTYSLAGAVVGRTERLDEKAGMPQKKQAQVGLASHTHQGMYDTEKTYEEGEFGRLAPYRPPFLWPPDSSQKHRWGR